MKRILIFSISLAGLLGAISHAFDDPAAQDPAVASNAAVDPSARPADIASDESALKKIDDAIGLRLEPAAGALPPAGRFRGGLTVKEATGPAEKAGIRVNDILVGLHVYETTNTADVAYALEHHTKPLKFYVVRGGETLFGHFGDDGSGQPTGPVADNKIDPPLVAAAPADPNTTATQDRKPFVVLQNDWVTLNCMQPLQKEGLVTVISAPELEPNAASIRNIVVTVIPVQVFQGPAQFKFLRDLSQAIQEPFVVMFAGDVAAAGNTRTGLLPAPHDRATITIRRTVPPSVVQRVKDVVEQSDTFDVHIEIEPKASLLVIKSDWSVSSANDIASEVTSYLKTLKIPDNLQENIPANAGRILFPQDLCLLYTADHAIELQRWLKDRELAVESSEFQPTPPGRFVWPPQSEVTKPLEFLGNLNPAVETETFVERRQQWNWRIRWYSGNQNITRQQTQVEQWRGEAAPRSPEVQESITFSIDVPDGYVGFVNAFATRPSAGFNYPSPPTQLPDRIALIVIENDGLQSVLQPRPSARHKTGFHLPDKVTQLTVVDGPSRSGGRGGFPGATMDPRTRSGGRGSSSDRTPANQPAATPAPAPEPEIRMFVLKHAKAEDTAILMQQVLGGDSVKFVADARTNTLIATADKDTLEKAEAIILRLDSADVAAGGDEKNVPAGADAPGNPQPAGDPAAGSSAVGLPVLRDVPVLGHVFQLDGDIDVLKQAYADREAEAAKLARQIREAGPKTPKAELDKLRADLRTAVSRAFHQRQTLLATELQEMQRRIQQVDRTLRLRQQIENEIVDRRVEDLLNPDLKWEAEGTTSQRTIPRQAARDVDAGKTPLPQEGQTDLPPTASSEGIDPFIQQVTPLLLERETLIQQVSPTHPQVKHLDAKIEALRKLLQETTPQEGATDSKSTAANIDGVWKHTDSRDIYLAISLGRAGLFEQGALKQVWRVDSVGRTQFDFVPLDGQAPVKGEYLSILSDRILQFVSAGPKGLEKVQWVIQTSVVPHAWAKAIADAPIADSAPSNAKFPFNGVWEWRGMQVRGGNADPDARPTLMIHEDLAAFCDGTEVQRRWKITTSGTGDAAVIQFTPLDKGAGMTGQVHGGEIQTIDADRKVERFFSRSKTEVPVEWFLAQFEGVDTAARSNTPGNKISLNFQNAPWLDALKLIAESANLSLDLRQTPSGNLTYQDQKEYTPAEAIDVLNGLLQAREFALIARNDSLVCVAWSELSDDLVPAVAVEALPERGKNEFVTVQVRFESGANVDLIADDVGKLLGSHGSVRKLASTNALILTGPAGDLLRVIGLIKNAPGMTTAAGGNQLIRIAGPKQPSDYLAEIQSLRQSIRAAQEGVGRGNPADFQERLELLKSEYENQLKVGATDVSAALAELEAAQEGLERTEALHKSAAISQSEVISAKERHAKARAAFEKAEAIQKLFLDGKAKLFPEESPTDASGAAPIERSVDVGVVSKADHLGRIEISLKERDSVKVGEVLDVQRPEDLPSGRQYRRFARVKIVSTENDSATAELIETGRTLINNRYQDETVSAGDIITRSVFESKPPAQDTIGRISEVVDAQTLIVTTEDGRQSKVGDSLRVMRPVEVTDPGGGKHMEPIRIAILQVVEVLEDSKLRTRVESQKAAQVLNVGDAVALPDAAPAESYTPSAGKQ